MCYNVHVTFVSPPRESLAISFSVMARSLLPVSSDDEEDDDCCVHCRRNDNAQEILECDSCDAGWHMCIAAAATHHQRYALCSTSPAPPPADRLTSRLCSQALPAAAAQAHPSRRVVLPCLRVTARAAGPVGGGASRQAGSP